MRTTAHRMHCRHYVSSTFVFTAHVQSAGVVSGADLRLQIRELMDELAARLVDLAGDQAYDAVRLASSERDMPEDAEGRRVWRTRCVLAMVGSRLTIDDSIPEEDVDNSIVEQVTDLLDAAAIDVRSLVESELDQALSIVAEHPTEPSNPPFTVADLDESLIVIFATRGP